MTRYKLGDVAIATVRGVPNVRVMAGEGTAEPKLRWFTTDNRVYATGDPDDEGWFYDFQVDNPRALVVIDPEDREQVERLAKAYTNTDPSSTPWSNRTQKNRYNACDYLQAALREFANPAPPEPTGLGAAIEATAYTDQVRHFVRVSGSGSPWYDASGNGHDWSELHVVRVLSEGVQS